MPCGDSRDAAQSYAEEARIATRVACELMRLKRSGNDFDLSEEASTWIAKHDLEDQRRADAEDHPLKHHGAADGYSYARQTSLRKSGLSKLSSDERRALGF